MRTLGLVALAAALLAGPASAHRGHSGLTVVEIDGARGEVRLTHRFAAHDVEPALVKIAPYVEPNLQVPEAIAALNDHLGRRFRLDLDGQPVDFTHQQTTQNGDRLQVVFVGKLAPDADIDAALVDLDFFPGVYDDLEIQVNLRSVGVTKTVVFRPGAQAQRVAF